VSQSQQVSAQFGTQFGNKKKQLALWKQVYQVIKSHKNQPPQFKPEQEKQSKRVRNEQANEKAKSKRKPKSKSKTNSVQLQMKTLLS